MTSMKVEWLKPIQITKLLQNKGAKAFSSEQWSRLLMRRDLKKEFYELLMSYREEVLKSTHPRR